MESTWETRDYPVLEAIVRLYDSEGSAVSAVSVQQLEADTRFSEKDVQKAVRALLGEDPAFINVGPMRGGSFSLVGGVTGHARRTVGAWPTADSLSERIVVALNDAADQEQDPEKKSRLRHAAEVGKGTIAGVLTHVLTQGI